MTSIQFNSSVDIPAADPDRCQHCVVRHQAVCGALASHELADLNAIARRRIYKAGQSIIIAEEETPYVATVVSGVIKLIQSMPDGRQQIVGLQFPPDFLGRAYGHESRYFAEAVGDVDLCLFPKKEFETLLSNYPDLEKRLFQDTLEELDVARDWMLLLGRKTAAERVASFLLLIARRAPYIGCKQKGDDAEVSFHLPMTRADIADYLGLTIETVSRQITKMKTQKVIQLHDNRDIAVLDMERLRDISGMC